MTIQASAILYESNANMPIFSGCNTDDQPSLIKQFCGL